MKGLLSLCAAGAIAGGALLLGQQIPEPRKQFGASVTGAFEGWFSNEDASRSFLVGYLNRNTQQELDIPIGPNNRIEPAGPDMGQRRISFPAGSGACSPFPYRRISPSKINSRGRSP